jgi:hypothetical protein
MLADHGPTPMTSILTDYYKLDPAVLDFRSVSCAPTQPGFFKFGADTVCFGHSSVGTTKSFVNGCLYDVSADVQVSDGAVYLPFDPAEVAANLRLERYVAGSAGNSSKILQRAIQNAYYLARPLMGVSIRRYLQRAHLTGWNQLPFPTWPVDCTIENLTRKLLALGLRAKNIDTLPFIWFWPNGATACAIMTHDVETEEGVAFSSQLMDIDESFGIPASFQIVPEKRYAVRAEYLDKLRERGFEVNVQDLNHDGRLYRDRDTFERRAKCINQYAGEYGAVGFRSGVLYRNQEWYDLLHFEYDMSVPNVAHLDPQHGGCCTVMPYFVGNMLELPVTTTQDYSLFHILNDYSLDLWHAQIGRILKNNGLISFVVHPDYIIDELAQQTYRALLSVLGRLRAQNNVWTALPREVNRWWRLRSQMRLVNLDGRWQIEGAGSERARVAFARYQDGQLVYTLD